MAHLHPLSWLAAGACACLLGGCGGSPPQEKPGEPDVFEPAPGPEPEPQPTTYELICPDEMIVGATWDEDTGGPVQLIVEGPGERNDIWYSTGSGEVAFVDESGEEIEPGGDDTESAIVAVSPGEGTIYVSGDSATAECSFPIWDVTGDWLLEYECGTYETGTEDLTLYQTEDGYHMITSAKSVVSPFPVTVTGPTSLAYDVRYMGATGCEAGEYTFTSEDTFCKRSGWSMADAGGNCTGSGVRVGSKATATCPDKPPPYEIPECPAY